MTVSQRGRLLAVGNGQTTVQLKVGNATQQVAVTVEGVLPKPIIDYKLQISPVLSKAGCNKGACHASQHGKGGFVLSVVGSDPDKDYASIVRDRVQRRVDLLMPERSLVLLKPTMQTPHGGGRRLEKGSVAYDLLVAWLAGGAPGPKADAPEVTKLDVTPPCRVGQTGMQQQLRAEATYSDGSVRDVTPWAKFDSLDEGMLQVDAHGLVKVTGKGQAPIMVRFEGQAGVAMFSVPYAENIELKDWQNKNFVDELAVAKFRELGIEPSPLCDDATFVRRAFLDCIGSLPTIDETKAFLQATEPDKREKLIDRLLGLTGDPAQDIYNDRYAAYWTLRWSDLIRNNSNDLGEQGMWSLSNWVREAFRVNKPFDRFVRELVTAKGSVYMAGPANFFRINRAATDLTEATSQLFLGIRLECAKCHHHPFEKYSQDDYYRFAAFFSRVGAEDQRGIRAVRRRASGAGPGGGRSQQSADRQADGADAAGRQDGGPSARPPHSTGRMADVAAERVLRQVGGQPVRGLSAGPRAGRTDRRSAVDQSADQSRTDERLGQEFVNSGFDLKRLVRTITTSRLYQLSSQPTAANAADDRFYSHFTVKRLAAEPLLDAVDRATGCRPSSRTCRWGRWPSSCPTRNTRIIS